MPSCGVGNGGGGKVAVAGSVAVAVQAGFGVMLGVGDWVTVAVAVAVGVWLGEAVFVGVAVLAMVGVWATVARALVSAVGEMAMATAVGSSVLFKTAPTKKRMTINSKNEPSRPLLWRLELLGVPRFCVIVMEHSGGGNGRQARFIHD